jgi:hypothetical protein
MPPTSNFFNRWGGKRLGQLLALFVAFALVPPVLLAQDEDHINGRDKVHDPSGTWLIIGNVGPGFLLITFHKGGTLTEDFQGESAFDPAAVNPPTPNLNVITSPQHGVWQKTGWNTFATTLVDIEYQVQAKGNAPVFRFDKYQYTGKLSESGDKMTLDGLVTFFDPDGNQLPPTEGVPFKINGVRIALEVLPNTSHTFPLPTPPPLPAP